MDCKVFLIVTPDKHAIPCSFGKIFESENGIKAEAMIEDPFLSFAENIFEYQEDTVLVFSDIYQYPIEMNFSDIKKDLNKNNHVDHCELALLEKTEDIVVDADLEDIINNFEQRISKLENKSYPFLDPYRWIYGDTGTTSFTLKDGKNYWF